MKLYMGIDQSYTSTGLVVLNDECDLIAYNLIETRPKDFVSPFLRARMITDKILDYAEKISPDFRNLKVGIEGLPYSSRSNVTRTLAGLQFAIVTAFPIEMIEEIEVYPPTMIKKLATGSGKANKEDMFNALPPPVKEEFKELPKTRGRYDATDAYFIAKTRKLLDGKKTNIH